MDEYGVPKKINRHVLKALHQQKDNGVSKVTVTEICDIVKYSMRNLTPVRDLTRAIRQSLKNLTHLGVIGRSGSTFFIRKQKLKPRLNLKMFGVHRRRMNKMSEKNLKKNIPEYDTLTRSAISKVRRRFDTVKKIRRRQRSVPLPKVRRFENNFHLNDGYDRDGNNMEFSNNEDEGERGNNYSRDGSRKNHLSSQASDTEMEQSPSQNDRNQNSNEAPNTEENQHNNIKDRSMTPKTGSTRRENVTTDNKADKAGETNANSSKGS